MKKFFVGLLSIFMLFGASLLSACGKTTPQLNVYYNGKAIEEVVDIQLNPQDQESGYILLSADMTGVGEPEITATAASGSENILTVDPAGVSNGKQYFKVTASTETTNGPAAVYFLGQPGNVEKYVYVNVYSNVSSMSQNAYEARNQFLVNGHTYTVNENGIANAVNAMSENQLIEFKPSQNSRRDLSWSIQSSTEDPDTHEKEFSPIAKDGTFTVNSNVIQTTLEGEKVVVLKAKDEINGEETTISLTVLEQISKSVEMRWTRTSTSSGTNADIPDDTAKVIISNISSDPDYQGYAWVGYTGKDLQITPVAYLKTIVGTEVKWERLYSSEEDRKGIPSELYLENNLSVLSATTDESNGYRGYSVSKGANAKTQEYKLTFQVGYKKYNYFGTTNPVYIDLQEKVNRVYVSTKNNHEMEGQISDVVIDIYNNYTTVKGISRKGNGQLFKVLLTPEAEDGSQQYYNASFTMPLDADLTQPGSCNVCGADTACPFHLYYMAPNGTVNLVDMEKTLDAYVTWTTKSPVSEAGDLYMIASSQLASQSVEGVMAKFTSVDNQNAFTSFKLNLKKSASQDNFEKIQELALTANGTTLDTNPDGSYKVVEKTTGTVIIDSSKVAQVYRKAFLLKGQSNIDGISLKYNNEDVEISNIKALKEDTVNNEVIFTVDFSLKANAYGKTTQITYALIHENGATTLSSVVEPDTKFVVKVSLPFTTYSIYPDMGNNLSNSISDIHYDGNDVKSMMLKNSTLTPVLLSMPSTNGYVPKISNVTVKYLDFDPMSGKISLEDFIKLYQKYDVNGDLQYVSADEFEDQAALAGFIELSGDSKNLYFDSTKVKSDLAGAISTRNSGYTYIVITLEGTGLDGKAKSISKVMLIESYVAPEGLSIKPAANRDISLYASDSVSSDYASLTYRDVSIVFDNPNVTYYDLAQYADLLTISSKFYAGDNRYKKYYSIEGVNLTQTGITFRITALSTEGKPQINDIIDVVYQIKKDSRVVYKIQTSIVLSINNAQRIENVSWKNYDSQGLYYEIGSSDTNRLVLIETTPTNAKDNSMYCLVTDEVGNVQTKVFDSTDEVATGMFSFNLGDFFTNPATATGMSGKIYILPQDAVNGGVLKYYFMEDEKTHEKIEFSNIESASNKKESPVQTCAATAIGMNYNELVKYGYFKSTTEEGTKIVSLADIILEIDLEIADGSEEHPFRVFSASQLINMETNLHYLVMNDIDLTGEDYETRSITGGVKGYNEDGNTTITLAGKALFGTISEKAYIKNLTFIGNVAGNGFVANTNEGTIDGVTVDTNGLMASRLSGSGTVGGLVQTNKNKITNSAVLGLKVTGTTVGGIAGNNSGEISSSRVEFYNLATVVESGVAKDTATNSFSATNAGGIVGNMTGGKIFRTYVYDYTLSASRKDNGLTDPFVGGTISGGEIDYVFAVVGLSSTSATIASENSYLGYYDTDTYKINNTNTQTNANFANPTLENGDPNPEFDALINNGQPYFKDFYQPKALSAQDVANMKVQDVVENNFYKSINVSTSKAILFFYQLTIDEETLSASEKIDYTQINTISVADLFGFDKSIGSVIVTSSNNRIVKPLGSSIQILSTGTVDITITSKQDVLVNKTISVTIVNPLTNLVLSRTTQAGKTINIENGNVVSIQKTTSIDVSVAQRTTSIYLGSLAALHNLKQPTWTIKTTAEAVDESKLEDGKEIVSSAAFASFVKLSASEKASTAVGTLIKIYPEMFTAASDEQKAIERIFTKQFVAQAADGVIYFEISGEELPLSPSTKAVVETRIETTFAGDSVVPMIVYNNKTMTITDNGNQFVYSDDFGNNILVATVIDKSSSTVTDGLYAYIKEVTFAVHPDYRRKVAQDMTFQVYFNSTSGNSSLVWGGQFNLVLSRQGFTNVDTSFVKVLSPRIENQREVFKTEGQISTLAPGNAAILKVTVNPEFAYYDYAEISFGGVAVANPVVLDAVEVYNMENGEYATLQSKTATTERVGPNLRYYPNAVSDRLYFKAWINTTVDKDSTIKFTISFYKNGQATPLDYVNAYLDISYLAEPKVTIDGEEIAFVAKGTTSQVKIQVREDQTVDSIALSGDFSLTGVTLSKLSEPEIDPTTGIKTYTASLRCFVDAGSQDKNRFFITASVSRTLNDETESKQTTATAVIVDFKVDDINIENANDGRFLVWQNISKKFDIEYSLLPEAYSSGEANQEEIDRLIASKEFFKNNHFYPQAVSAADASAPEYYINWLQDKATKQWTKQSILDRLFVRTGGGDVHYTNVDLPFTFSCNEETGLVQVKGTSVNTPSVTMVLYTYIYAGGVQTVVETQFVMSVVAFSDPDLPLSIKSAADFIKLNPSRKQEGANNDQSATAAPQDYILENDIVLENYIPFSTSLIRSLDGNGYTIYLKSFDLETPTELKLSLFDEVSKDLSISEVNTASQTTLKNLRVNYYNGGQITVDVSRHSSVEVAGIAITNQGIITNCEVVSFFETNMVGETITDIEPVLPCIQHTKPQGFNIAYRNGENTTEDVFLADNSKWSSSVAGFVLDNQGSITNSRVGGDEVIMIDTVGVQNDAETLAHRQTLGKFSIIAQGNVAGFVGSNGGKIASSFAKNIEIKNSSAATKFWTAGFVGENDEGAAVITSYAEGVKSEDTTNSAYLYANMGSSLTSNMGFIAGFSYSNKGEIKDSYSNILIANSTSSDRVYLASGFVYTNEGALENCYSASQVANANYSQMNFSGVNTNGQLLANGTYDNCYFYSAELYVEEKEDVYDDTTESQYKTGAKLVANPSIESSFYGFAIAESEDFFKDGIWKCSVEEGIRLVEPDYIAKSHRYKVYTNLGSENSSDEYVLPYAILTVDGNLEYDTALGGKHNPILIADAQDWQEISGSSLSSYVQMTFDEYEIFGVYRVVNDIDFSTLKEELLSTYKNFTGALFGNGFQLSKISLSQTNEEILENGTLSFGLFSTMSGPVVDKLKESRPTLVLNVDMQIDQVTAGLAPSVGGLAGIARGATLINIEVAFAEENSTSVIEGLNFAGGLVGFAYGENKVKNIIVKNPNVIADTFTEGNEDNYIKDLSTFRNAVRNNVATALTTRATKYSYAGGVIGYIDSYKVTEQAATAYTAEDTNQEVVYDINYIRVSGAVQVKAQVVGGVFGLSGYNTKINDAIVTVTSTETTASRLISTRYFAGGLVGQAYGRFSRVLTVHEDEIQQEIEENMGSYYSSNNKSAERGALDIFDTTNIDLDNKQVAVGGLFGYVGSGMLEVSYSKLNVTSMSAQYAGGIIGMMDVSDTETYTAKADALMTDDAHNETRYFINEVFATGDVRASVMAGGIIGVVRGQDSKIKLLAVNAMNYITTYDYATGGETPVDANQFELSSTLKVNSFVGHFIHLTQDKEGNITAETVEKFNSRQNPDPVLTGKTIDNFITLESGTKISQYLQLCEATDAVLDTGEGLPSTSRFRYYQFGEQKLYFKRFGEPFINMLDPISEYAVYNTDSENKVDQVSFINQAETPALFASASAGKNYTQAVFLNSGIWSYNNWSHPIDSLFPVIRLTETLDMSYLDLYNAATVLEYLNNEGRNSTVIVRGLKEANLDVDDPSNYSHIEIAVYTDGSGYPISDEKGVIYYIANNGKSPDDPNNQFHALGSNGGAFSGRIIGGRYPETSLVKTQIITSENFIHTLGEGASIIDQEFVFDKGLDTIAVGSSNHGAGLFIKNEIQKVTLTNVTLTFKSPVLIAGAGVEASHSYEQNYGLVAPVIRNSSINGLTINNQYSTLSTASLLTVSGLKQNETCKIDDETTEAVEDQTTGADPYINIGTFAGKLINSTADEAMVVQGLALNKADGATDTLISVSGNASAKWINIGGYFGKITEGYEGQSQFITYLSAPSWQGDYINIFNKDVGSSNLNVGGFAGYLEQCDSIRTETGRALTSSFVYGLSGNYGFLNVGNVFGLVANGSATSVVGQENGSADIKMILVGTDTLGSKFDTNDEFMTGYKNNPVTALQANIGGVVGNHAQGNDEEGKATISAPLVIKNFAKVDIKANIIGDNDETKIANFSGEKELIVAGYVGISRSPLLIENNAESTVTGSVILNANTKQIRLIAASVLGATTAVSVGNTPSFKFASSLLSTLAVDITNLCSAANAGQNDVEVAGVVGKIYSDSTTNNVDVKINSEEAGKRIVYNGIVKYYGYNTFRFGGVIAQVSLKGTKSDKITIGKKNSSVNSFGGKITLTQGVAVDIGGSIGTIATVEAAELDEIKLFDSYNYGDVFVDYSASFTGMGGEYCFGGLIGNLEKAKYVIENNFSAMTSHNARYLQSSNTAHALIGKGTPTTDGDDEYVSGNTNSINYNSSANNQWNNFYSHAVCLLNESYYNGRDIGYKTGYTTENRWGYMRGGSDAATLNIIHRILYGLSVYKGTSSEENTPNFSGIGNPFPVGHKLNPVSITGIKNNASNEMEINSAIALGSYAGNNSHSLLDGSGKFVAWREVASTNGTLISSEIIEGQSNTYQNKLDSLIGVGAYNFTDDLVYYTLGKDITVNADDSKTGSFTYSYPSAFIGDNFQISFNNANPEVRALFNQMYAAGHATKNDFSFISSLVEEVDMKIESVTYQPYAALAANCYNYGDPDANGKNHIKNGEDIIFYAINAYGKIEVGGSKHAQVAGLIKETCGKISDCSTDIDIISRTNPSEGENKDSYVAAFADLGGYETINGKVFSLVENCYAMGSVTVLNGAQIIPFISAIRLSTTGAFNSANGNNCYIENCYSATRIDWRDYLNVKDFADLTKNVNTWKLGEVSKISTNNANYIDADATAIGYEGTNVFNYSNRDYSSANGWFNTLKNETAPKLKAHESVWESNAVFNYFYPTLKYDYLKTSSYVIQTQVACDCGHIHSGATKCSDKTYDCYIDNYSYERVKNGTTKPNDEQNSYFMITSAAALAYRIKNSLAGEFVVMYDMDLSKSSQGTKLNNMLNGQTFTGKLDGQGHTMKGLTTNLFNSVSGGYIKNIRLTEASTAGLPLLSKTISAGAIVSNITLNGDISGVQVGSDGNVGALTKTITGENTSVAAVQSSVNIASNGQDVGGIAVLIGDKATVRYCSNYGNIVVYNSTNHSSVGGIAGSLNDGNIEYSYNAGAVWVNYKTDRNADFTVDKPSYAGGIAGFAWADGNQTKTSTITGCYNTGMIKAGNKQVTSTSYAGGILGHKDHPVTITNCYNEGSVEALAKNGTYNMKVARCAESTQNVEWFKPLSSPDGVGTYYMIVYQESEKNVYAYGIGPGADDSNIFKVRQDESGKTSVFANGAGLEKYTVSATKEINQKSIAMIVGVNSQNNWTKDYSYNERSFIWTATDIDNRDERAITRVQMKYVPYSGTINADTSATYLANDNTNKNYATVPYTFAVASKNFVGLPTAVSYWINYLMTIKLDWRQKEHGCFGGVPDLSFEQATSSFNRYNSDTNMATTVLKEQFVKGLNDLNEDGVAGKNNITNEYFFRTIINSDDSSKMRLNNFNEDAPNYASYTSGRIASSDGSSIVVATRSSKEYKPEETYNQLKVSDKTFFLAGNNSLAIFQSGLQSATLKETITLIDSTNASLPSSNSYGLYSYSLLAVYKGGTMGTANQAAIGYSQPKLTDNGDGTLSVEITIFSSEENPPATVDYAISVDYNNQEEADLSDLSLTYKGSSLYAISSSTTMTYSQYWESVEYDGKTYYLATLTKTGVSDKRVYLYYDSGFMFDQSVLGNGEVSLQDLVGSRLKFNTTTSMLKKLNGEFEFSSKQEFTTTLDLDSERVLAESKNLTYQGYLTEEEKNRIESNGQDVVFVNSSNQGKDAYHNGSFKKVDTTIPSYYKNVSGTLEKVSITGTIEVTGTGPYTLQSVMPDNLSHYSIIASTGEDVTACYSLSGTTLTRREGEEAAPAPSKVNYWLDESAFVKAYKMDSSIVKYYYSNGVQSLTENNEQMELTLSSGKKMSISAQPTGVSDTTYIEYVESNLKIKLKETYSDLWILNSATIDAIPQENGQKVAWTVIVDGRQVGLCYNQTESPYLYTFNRDSKIGFAYLQTHKVDATKENTDQYSIVLGTGETRLSVDGTAFVAKDDKTQIILTHEGIDYLYSQEAGDKPSDSTTVTFMGYAKINNVEYQEGNTVTFSSIKNHIVASGMTVELEYGDSKIYSYDNGTDQWSGDEPEEGARVVVKSGTVTQTTKDGETTTFDAGSEFTYISDKFLSATTKVELEWKNYYTYYPSKTKNTPGSCTTRYQRSGDTIIVIPYHYSKYDIVDLSSDESQITQIGKAIPNGAKNVTISVAAAKTYTISVTSGRSYITNSMRVQSKNRNNALVETDKNLFTVRDSTITFFAKNGTSNMNASFVNTGYVFYRERGTTQVTDTTVTFKENEVEGKDIILTHDISFNSETNSPHQMSYNIIGNGYHLSYFGSQTLLEGIKTDITIRDISILGEVGMFTETTNYLFTQAGSGTGLLRNAALYGTLQLPVQQYGAYTDTNYRDHYTAGVLMWHMSVKTENIRAYVSIDATHHLQNVELLASSSAFSTHCRVVAASGIDNAIGRYDNSLIFTNTEDYISKCQVGETKALVVTTQIDGEVLATGSTGGFRSSVNAPPVEKWTSSSSYAVQQQESTDAAGLGAGSIYIKNRYGFSIVAYKNSVSDADVVFGDNGKSGNVLTDVVGNWEPYAYDWSGSNLVKKCHWRGSKDENGNEGRYLVGNLLARLIHVGKNNSLSKSPSEYRVSYIFTSGEGQSDGYKSSFTNPSRTWTGYIFDWFTNDY